VAEYGHDDPDVYAVLNEQRCRGMAAVMDSNISHVRFSENVLPLLPVVSRIDGTSVRPAENEVAVPLFRVSSRQPNGRPKILRIFRRNCRPES